MKNANARMVTAYKNCRENFYVLDTETNGFKYNEPVQIAAVRFKNGEKRTATKNISCQKNRSVNQPKTLMG